MNFINSQINQNISKSGYFWRLALLFASLLMFSILFNKASLFLIFTVLAVAIIFIFFKDKIWLLLILAVPALTLGEVVSIPVTLNWVYEARLSEIFLVLAALVFLSDKYLTGRLNEFKFDKISFFLLIYFLFSLLLISQIIDWRYFVVGMKVVVFSFLSYFLGLNLLSSKRKLKLFFYSLIFSSLILSSQLFWKFYSLGFSAKFFFERNTVLIPLGPIATVAAILAFLSIINLAFYFNEKKQDKISPLVFIIFLLNILAIFLTLGKGAIASLTLGLAFIFWKIKSSRIVLFLIFLWFIVLAYVFLNQFFLGLWERLKMSAIDANTKFRILEYEVGWRIIKNNLFFGVGAGQQLVYFKKLLNFETSQLVNNFFLQALIDLGLIGFSLILLLIGGLFGKIKILKNKIKNNPLLLIGFTAALLCAFINGLVEVTFYALPYAIVFWLASAALANLELYE